MSCDLSVKLCLVIQVCYSVLILKCAIVSCYLSVPLCLVIQVCHCCVIQMCH